MNPIEDILEQFPKKSTFNTADYQSFIFQPNRLSVNSRLSVPATATNVRKGNTLGGYFYNFKTNLRNPVLGLRSLELLRATIPNAVPNIPNDECVFWYYKIPAITGDPNYSKLFDVSGTQGASNLRMVRLLSSYSYSPTDYTTAEADTYGFNKTFTSYQDLVDTLNKAALNDPDETTLQANRLYEPGDIRFYYDDVHNKIGWEAMDYGNINNPSYYYVLAGFQDENIIQRSIFLNTIVSNKAPSNYPFTLARRMGFLFDFEIGDGLVGQPGYAALQYNTLPSPVTLDIDTSLANTYCNLVHSANLFLYCDITGGGTQDTNVDERLLAVIPMNTGNLGVNFGESKIPCEISKISKEFVVINFIMRTDTGSPFYLPVSAYVNLELKLNYE